MRTNTALRVSRSVHFVIYFFLLGIAFVTGCGSNEDGRTSGSKPSGPQVHYSELESEEGDIEIDSANYTNIILRSRDKLYAIQLIDDSPVLVEVTSSDQVTIEIPDSNSNRLIYQDRAYAIIVDAGSGSLSLIEVL